LPLRSALDLPLTAAEAGAGLVPPAAATYLLGKGGSILIILMLFMAVTSSGSAELIAVSSLFTYDVYRCALLSKKNGRLRSITVLAATVCWSKLAPAEHCARVLCERVFDQPAARGEGLCRAAALWLQQRHWAKASAGSGEP
jgi:hypothetical protein